MRSLRASPVGAVKSYYNLDARREAALSKPLDWTRGAWCVNGFIDEWLMERPAARKATYRQVL
jgi:hypothetical protein